MADVELKVPTEREIIRANEISHSFVRFMISEGIHPDDAMTYIAACAAQIVMNVVCATGFDEDDVSEMFRQNMLFFIGHMGERRTEYPCPRKEGF